jgi:sigma-B regulation protein RsbU (phosphoserine phosphatase)
MKNLWTDIEAISRLARSEQAVEGASKGARPVRVPASRKIFPAFPEREEFEVHAVESPSKMVTGDFFDFFLVSEGTLAISMADVSGKGAPAALMMEVTRSMVRNLSSVSSSPAETLHRVNRILYEANLGSMYLTIFLGWYDVGTGALTYSNAGHPVPYRVGRDGDVAPFGEVTGPILGILDVDGYGEDVAQVGVGERVVLYTDGVTEATSPDGEFFGPERFKEILARYAGCRLDRMCQLVARHVDEFQANQRYDDTTLMALGRVT